MKPKEDFWVKAFVTGFGCGYSPIIPGTIASLFGFSIYCIVRNFIFIYGLILVLSLYAGFIFIPRAERIFKKKDDKKIVIDEIFGILFCFWGLPFINWFLGLTGFLIFRVLDILKPPPARQIESLNGASGVMLDDFFVALYTNLVLRMIIGLTG